MDTKSCPECGGAIVRRTHWRPSYWAQKQFCSRQCATTANARKLRGGDRRPCRRCGAPIVAKGTTRRYCSTDCYNADRAERSVMEPRALGRSRAVRRFPAQPCEVCGTTTDVHRHHRDGDQTNNTSTNIAFLCRDHHWDEHAAMAAARIGRPRGGPRPRVVTLMRDRAVARARSAAALREQGMSVSDIAREMGVNVWSVHRWFRKYDV